MSHAAPPPEPPAGGPARTSPEPRWGLGDVAAGLLAGLALSTLFGGLWLGVGGGDSLGLGGRAFSQVGLWVGLVGVVVLASRLKGSGSLAADFGYRARLEDLGIGALVGVAAQFVVVPAATLLMRPIVGRPDVGGPVRDLVNQSGGAKAWGLVLMAAVGAPLVEELFFRGLLLRSLAKRIGEAWAIAGSAVLFGLAHPNNLPAGAMVTVMVGLAAFGAMLAFVAARTGRLGACVVAHATFNAISLAVAFSR